MTTADDDHSFDWELRLGYLIHDVSRLRRSAFDRVAKPLNLTRSQWWLLAILSREDGMTQVQLSEELDLGKVAVGGLIDRLAKSGLVRREADPTDRRVNRIFLEPKSRQIISRMRKVSHRLNIEIQAGIPAAELEMVAKTLAKLKHSLL